MAQRPTQGWREAADEEAAQLAAGIITPDQAFATKLFPESLLTGTDNALATFEAELDFALPPPDQQVFAIVEHVILNLNQVNAAHDDWGYKTEEREQLCAYIDASLEEAGINVAQLAARRGIERWEVTDEWRHW